MIGDNKIYRQPDGVFIINVGYRLGRLAHLPALGWSWRSEGVAVGFWECRDAVRAHASARELGLEIVPHPSFGEAS